MSLLASQDVLRERFAAKARDAFAGLLKASIAAVAATELHQRKATSYNLLRRIHRERKRVAAPSKAQAEAGNYAKGHLRIHGLQISIENSKGSTRSGVSRDGKAWSREMACDYGYFRRTEGADGDHVDVYIGPDPEVEIVYVIDQQDPATRRFDEHKCCIGVRTEDEARQLYLSNYPDGWKGLRNITAMTIGQFKAWLRDGDLSQPAAGATVKMAAAKLALKFAELGSREFSDGNPPAAPADLQEKVSEDTHPRVDPAPPASVFPPSLNELVKAAIKPEHAMMFGMLDDVLAMSMAMRARRRRAAQATPVPMAAPAPTTDTESKVAATMPRDCPALVRLSLRGKDVQVCPRCGKEIKHALYKDKKGWLFARCCFGKGSGPVKEAGIPTYAASAALPAAMYGARKLVKKVLGRAE